MDKTWGKTLACVLPFATWMGLMTVLPSSALSYAIRSAVTMAAGVACIVAWLRISPAAQGQSAGMGGIAAGIAAGAAVCALWIAIPAWPFPEPAAPSPSPYDPAVCGWPLTIAKLAGSAFVIAPAEEAFFRSFLYRRIIARDFSSVPMSRFDASAFFWTVLLFTLEHDRPVAAAVAGAAYGLLAIRFGIASAVAAHATTNLLLGLHVIFHNAWRFW